MTVTRFSITALVLLAGLASLLLVGLDLEAPFRAPITLVFSLVGPGWAVVQLLRLRDAIHELVLTLAISLTLTGLVAGASVYLLRWSPGLVLAVLVVITGLALAASPVRASGPISLPPEGGHHAGRP